MVERVKCMQFKNLNCLYELLLQLLTSQINLLNYSTSMHLTLTG